VHLTRAGRFQKKQSLTARKRSGFFCNRRIRQIVCIRRIRQIKVSVKLSGENVPRQEFFAPPTLWQNSQFFLPMTNWRIAFSQALLPGRRPG